LHEDYCFKIIYKHLPEDLKYLTNKEADEIPPVFARPEILLCQFPNLLEILLSPLKKNSLDEKRKRLTIDVYQSVHKIHMRRTSKTEK